jgi:HEAT repeat protein
MYRRLLVEVYGAIAYPLLHRTQSSDPAEVKTAEEQLERLGERAVKPLLDALSDRRGAQQETATTLLTYVGNPSAAPALFSYATGDAEPKLRARAMLAVGALSDKALVPKLLSVALPEGKTLSDASDPVVLAAAWGLARMRAPEAQRALSALAERGAPGPRTFGILGLALLDDKRAARTIGKALTDPDSGSLPRAAAAFAAGELGLTQYASLLGELSESPDPTLSGAALLSLARLSGKGAGERIARHLVSTDPERRSPARAAALVLGSGLYRRRAQPLPIPSGDLDAARALESLIPTGYSKADERVALVRLDEALETALTERTLTSKAGARAAVEVLSSEGGKLPFSSLLVESARDPETQKLALKTADRIAHALVPAFVDLAEHPAAEVRRDALGFLAQRSEPAAVRAVVNGVHDRDADTQRSVLSRLGARHAAAAEPVTALLARPDWSLRTVAVEALGRLIENGEPRRALEALEKTALGDETALVREAALRALHRAAPAAARRALTQASGADPEPRVRKSARALLEEPAPLP